MHHHVRQLSVSIVRTVESDICRCISPRGFRSIQRTITGLGGVGPAPCVGERVELRLAHLPARFAKQDIVIGVRVKRRIEIQDRHSHWEIPSDRKASEDCHRNKRDSFQTDGERFLHFGRNDKASPQLQADATACRERKWNGSAYSAGYRRLLQSYEGAIRFTIA